MRSTSPHSSKGLPTRETLCSQVCPSELGRCHQQVPIKHDPPTLAGGHTTWGAQVWPACRFSDIPSSAEANLTPSYLSAKDSPCQCIGAAEQGPESASLHGSVWCRILPAFNLPRPSWWVFFSFFVCGFFFSSASEACV